MLKTYYETEGKTDPVRITLPNRSAPDPDGTKAKQWIVAQPLDLSEGPEVPLISRRDTRGWLKIAGPAIAVCIAAYILVVLVESGDNRPQVGRLDGATLTILNTEGKELWHKTFPGGFWPFYYDQGMEQRIWFGDLDGDGHTEVLFLCHPSGNPKSHSTTLICYSSRGTEKWRLTPGRALPELGGTPPVYLTFGFGVLKAAKGGHRRIVLSSQNEPYYPDQVAIIDANGKTVSEYWHSGILNHLALADLSGDGREEIIASGISNGYDQATLIVLDPDRVYGASSEVARPEVQLHGFGDAQERLRLLFPRSDLNRALSVYNIGQDMTIDQGRVRLTVWECSLTPKCLILYEIDKDFRLRSVTPDDQF